ncbi:MAG: Mov34/MPN/PAD-1 family protein [Candidatus Heimdallarchaeota archaeon]
MEKISTIVLPRKLLEKIVFHAQKALPNESVSIIGGKIEGETAHSKVVFTPENEDRSQVTFSVDPITLLDIYKKIEQQGLKLIAIYHTHPAAPKPSGTDLFYMEVNPYVWLISSTSEPERPQGYLLLKDGTLKKITVKIIN